MSRWVPALCLDASRGSQPWNKLQVYDCSAHVSPREAEISLMGVAGRKWKAFCGPAQLARTPEIIHLPPVGRSP